MISVGVDLEGLGVTIDATVLLDDVDVSVPAGMWWCLIGPNGAGKSTLLRAVTGLVRHRGRVLLDGVEAGLLSRRERARTVALVPQDPVVPAGITVADYVLLGRTPRVGPFGVEGPSDRAVVGALLDRLELVAMARRELGTLSGGERQRAVLARALATEAPVLVLDEPTTSLDVGAAQEVLELVDELRREHHLTVLSALHDLTLAGQFADTLCLLDAGRVVAAGPPGEVLDEELLAERFRARVRVVEVPGGGRAVVPVRRVRQEPVGGRDLGVGAQP